MASLTPPAAAGTTAPVNTGRRLGKYEILRHIATGGMAEIHLARATGIEGFEKLCVIKQILPNLAENREFVDMFLDEARLAATLHHSNVVQVYDIGAVGGVYFFSMEFLHGEDVGRIHKACTAKGERFPLDHAMSIAIGACAGLHYAHDKCGMDGRPLNIVHRDVSPANVFVTFDGGVKLLDFGIAKASLRHTETRVGTLKGKIRYMSPEQCRGGEVDRRSDVFSLSVMLWELTTGQRLFEGQTEFEVLESIVHRDARPASWACPGYPPELERILQRGLQRHPAARYQTAEDFQIDLEGFARENKLVISSVALSRWVKGLFAEKLAAWQRAQQEGKAFADYLADAYGHGHEASASGRRDPPSGRRTRTETSGEPLQSPTVAGSPSSLLQMMAAAGALPATGPTRVVEDDDLQIIEGTPIQEIPAAAAPGPCAAAPDATVHQAWVGAETVAAPFSSSDSIDAVDVADEFGADRARTTETQSRYVAPAPPRLRLGVIAAVAVAFVIPAVGVVLYTARSADPAPQILLPPGSSARGLAPEPAGPGPSPASAPSERPAPASAPAVAPAPQKPTAAEVASERPPPAAKAEKPKPAARPEKPKPAARPEKPKPAPRPKAPPKPRTSGSDLDPLLPP